MGKWWWKLEHDSGMWHDIIKAKYLRGQGIFYAKRRPGDSACWGDLLHLRQVYLKRRCVMIGNGRTTDFWGDTWCGHTPFCQMFPNLRAINQEIGLTVKEMYEQWWHLTFRRWLDPAL
ncbi:hypothetical protein BRADI_2g41335v3 [Brachypodium distachyon]|uniref:Reverse transcriptase zinc-binding domain-containing protein n=1 Tax=Brachypodium distachyon TaxID=15368 RepID=A0A2K2DD52_BRADI|nr:hypothetical protein BRADI_2g41335v3 [Brachypodium distachyon]